MKQCATEGCQRETFDEWSTRCERCQGKIIKRRITAWQQAREELGTMSEDATPEQAEAFRKRFKEIEEELRLKEGGLRP